MNSFWRLLNKPRVDDWSPLAKVFFKIKLGVINKRNSKLSNIFLTE